MTPRRSRSLSSASKRRFLTTCGATLAIAMLSALAALPMQGAPSAHGAPAPATIERGAPATGLDADATQPPAQNDPVSTHARRVAFDTGDSGGVLHTQVSHAALSPADQALLDKLVAKMHKVETLLADAEEHLATNQANLDAANQALLDALAMPATTPAEIKAQKIAIKKANRQIEKYTKKVAKWTKHVAEYTETLAMIVQKILAIDPGYFGGGDPNPTSLPPAAPEGVTASGGAQQVTVSWNVVDNATAYSLFWSTFPSVTTATGTLVADVTSPWVHTGLADGQTYYYILTASNDAGTSDASAEASAQTDPAPDPDPGPGDPPGNIGSKVGMNFTELTYYASEWVFTDAMKQSMRWLSQEADSGAWDTGDPLTLDGSGWPILGTNAAGHPEAAGTLMYRDIGGHYPAGQYVCLYDGEGTIQFGFDAHVVSQTPGRIVVGVDSTSSNGIYLKITASNPANHIRNVRLMLPGFENTTETFHPLFKQRIAPFSVLRFMTWQNTNSGSVPNWANRTLPTTQTQDQPEGVALEYMIDLCNEMGADPWLCMRVQATDAWVTQFATLLRDRLGPGRKAYIEHGNEIWNGMYGDFQYCINKGVALGYDANGAGQYLAGLRYHSERSVQIFNIFESVFGGTSRLVRVLGAQGANPWTGQQIMDWKNAYQHADALSVANYFGYLLDDSPNVVNMSVQQILDYCSNDISNLENGFVLQNANNAHSRGLKLVCYESGQHLCGVGANLSNPAVTAKFTAVNRDPGMYELYRKSFEGWQTNGGDVNVAFAAFGPFSLWGSWGAMEYIDQDPSPATSPKFAGLMDHIAAQQAAGP